MIHTRLHRKNKKKLIEHCSRINEVLKSIGMGDRLHTRLEYPNARYYDDERLVSIIVEDTNEEFERRYNLYELNTFDCATDTVTKFLTSYQKHLSGRLDEITAAITTIKTAKGT